MIEITPRQDLTLPDVAAVGTVILDDIAALSRVGQRRLKGWLDYASGRTQVISAASVSILPMIDEGRFDGQLYYRLNTYYVDLSDFGSFIHWRKGTGGRMSFFET